MNDLAIILLMPFIFAIALLGTLAYESVKEIKRLRYENAILRDWLTKIGHSEKMIERVIEETKK